MRKLILLLSILSSSVMAHSQDTTEQFMLPYFKSETVKISVTNLNSYPQQYEIVVRNYDQKGNQLESRTLGRTEEFKANESKKLTVRLTDITSGTDKDVCTKSIPVGKQILSTLICTKFNFDWRFSNEIE